MSTRVKSDHVQSVAIVEIWIRLCIYFVPISSFWHDTPWCAHSWSQFY